MKGKVLKKLTAVFVSLCILLTVSSAVLAAGGYAVKITDVTVSGEGEVTSASMTVAVAGTYTVYAAVYEGDTLQEVALETKELSQWTDSVTFTEPVSFDETTQLLKCYVWDGNKPVAKVYTKGLGTADSAADEEAETGNGTITYSGTSVSYDGDTGVAISGTTATINKPGTYTVTGSLTDGTDGRLEVNYTSTVLDEEGNELEANITLDGVTLSNSSTAPFYGTAGKITLAAASGTTNTFNATASSTKAKDNVALYSADDLTIKSADATANIVAKSANGKGIQSGADLDIGLGNVSVTSYDNGIQGKKSVKVTKQNTSVTVTTTGDGDGIKSNKDPSLASADTYKSGGTVTINGGNINITTGSVTADGVTSTGDGIQADTLLTIANSPTITINATGEALKANSSSIAYIEDGTDEATTALDPAGDGCIVISGGTLDLTAGEDGIKATKDITISGGSVTVKEAGDDGIQAGDIVIDETTPSNSQKIDGVVTISGGTVNINAPAGDGIIANQTYTQSSGDVTITSYKDGIQAGKAYTMYDITENSSDDDEEIVYETNGVVNITGGGLKITTSGGATDEIKEGRPLGSTSNEMTNITKKDYSCKGIKARRLISISGGTLDIDAYDDAIHSNHTARISGDAVITARSCDDGVHGEYCLYISGGKTTVTKSYEGIEGAIVRISDGEVYVVAEDDGANAACDSTLTTTYEGYMLDNVYTTTLTVPEASSSSSTSGGGGGWGGGASMKASGWGYMVISGGLLYIDAEGDGFDSNGSAVIEGGYVLINGPTSGGNGVFDKGDNSGDTFTITGGTVIGVGSYDQGQSIFPSSTTGSQPFIYSTSATGSKGTAIQFTDDNGTYTFVPSKSYVYVLISTPNMTSGTSYTMKYNGSASGGNWIKSYDNTYGLKSDAAFSGGSSATVTAVTSAGSSGGGGQGGGNQPPSRP